MPPLFYKFVCITLFSSLSVRAYDYSLLRQHAINGTIVTSMGTGCGNMAIGWVRTVFHDFGTYDAAAGTGGLDASILTYDEANLPDNTAILFGGNIEFFRQQAVEFPSVSAADWIAFGALVGLRRCGGPDLTPRFRPGRKSVYTPNDGRLLPDFRQPLPELKAIFARMNLTTDEYIILTLGSHSLGGANSTVGSIGFMKSPALTFDGTPTTFDNKIWQRAINASNPLVLQSDREIMTDPRAIELANLYAVDQDAFFAAYGEALMTMLDIGHPELGCPLSGDGCTPEQMVDTPIADKLTKAPVTWYKPTKVMESEPSTTIGGGGPVITKPSTSSIVLEATRSSAHTKNWRSENLLACFLVLNMILGKIL